MEHNWFLPLMSILVTILIAFIGNIATMCYWAGKMISKVDGMEKYFMSTCEIMKSDILLVKHDNDKEVEKREADVKAIWTRIDELREIIASDRANRKSNG